jgi:hypothetical protein|tara:strand:- start:326 stop:805 length:480 start_codon:yes stop_codon:yes gene_type:complete
MNFQLYSRVILILFFFISCEPDDICLESNEDTPNLILKFVDSFSGENKSVSNLRIKGINNIEDFFVGTVDSISIPLNNYENTSSFSFTKEFESNQSNEDLIYFNYIRNNVYISRSCGYKMEYDIENIIIENDNSNWIEDAIIETRTVNNEISHHVKIYH